MTHPGEQFYPEGVHWDEPIARGTLPDLLSKAAVEFGARPAIEFRDRPISYAELEGMVEVAASAFLHAGYGTNHSVALFLGNSPDHPVNFFGALKAGARIVHLSPLDGERALSHKLSDSGARILVTSDLAAHACRAAKERLLSDAGAVSPRTLSRVLAHAVSPRAAIVEAMTLEMTGGSLQSAEQLMSVCTSFGIVPATENYRRCS